MSERKVTPWQWTEFSNSHWGRLVLGKRMDYWPTTGRFKWNDQTMFGDPDAFIKELMEEQHRFQKRVIQQALQNQAEDRAGTEEGLI